MLAFSNKNATITHNLVTRNFHLFPTMPQCAPATLQLPQLPNTHRTLTTASKDMKRCRSGYFGAELEARTCTGARLRTYGSHRKFPKILRLNEGQHMFGSRERLQKTRPHVKVRSCYACPCWPATEPFYTFGAWRCVATTAMDQWRSSISLELLFSDDWLLPSSRAHKRAERGSF